ncbi:hypothetical protein B1A_09443, partial [mine drainage metagenome]
GRAGGDRRLSGAGPHPPAARPAPLPRSTPHGPHLRRGRPVAGGFESRCERRSRRRHRAGPGGSEPEQPALPRAPARPRRAGSAPRRPRPRPGARLLAPAPRGADADQPRHPGYWNDLLQRLEDEGIHPRTMPVTQVELTKRFVEEGLGVSFLPERSVRRELLE